MKKFVYLLIAGSLSVFAACGGAQTKEDVAYDVSVENEAEATGCQVKGGTCLADHSCCAPAVAEDVKEADAGNDHDAEGLSYE